MPKTRDVNSPTDEERLIEAVETALKGRPQPGDVGHMLHEDEPLIVVRLGDSSAAWSSWTKTGHSGPPTSRASSPAGRTCGS